MIKHNISKWESCLQDPVSLVNFVLIITLSVWFSLSGSVMIGIFKMLIEKMFGGKEKKTFRHINITHKNKSFSFKLYKDQKHH